MARCPPSRAGRAAAGLALIWALADGLTCHPAKPATPDPFWPAPTTPLAVPQVEGWAPDGGLAPLDANISGGVVLRLTPLSYVVGSPRLEVVLDPPAPSPTLLQTFLTRCLQDVARLERGGQVHIHHVEQRRTHVGRHDAYRVSHEYTLGQGAQTLAIRQISVLLVIDGRGLAITVIGRVELFHPLAEGIGQMLDGLRIAGEEALPPAAVVPEDLGTLGG